MNTLLKDKILIAIFANELFSEHIVPYSIHIEEANFVSSDNKAILSSDNKVFLGNDSGLESNNTFFVSSYTTEEIETTLTTIYEY